MLYVNCIFKKNWKEKKEDSHSLTTHGASLQEKTRNLNRTSLYIFGIKRFLKAKDAWFDFQSKRWFTWWHIVKSLTNSTYFHQKQRDGLAAAHRSVPERWYSNIWCPRIFLGRKGPVWNPQGKGEEAGTRPSPNPVQSIYPQCLDYIMNSSSRILREKNNPVTLSSFIWRTGEDIIAHKTKENTTDSGKVSPNPKHSRKSRYFSCL